MKKESERVPEAFDTKNKGGELLQTALECAEHIKEEGYNWEVAVSNTVEKFNIERAVLEKAFPRYLGGKKSAEKYTFGTSFKKALFKMGLKEDGPPQLRKADGTLANI